VATGTFGLAVVDLSAPSSPSLVGLLETSDGWNAHLAVSRDYAYLANGELGVVVVDITSPGDPRIVSIMPLLDGTSTIAVREPYVYSMNNHSFFWVIDVSDHSSPELVGGVQTRADGRTIDLDGDFAYLCGDEWGVHVVDVSDPTAPRIVGAVPSPMYAVGADIVDGYLYVADQPGGLIVAPTHCQPTIFPPRGIESAQAIERSRVVWWPNPARTASTVRFDLPQTAHVTIEIVDLGGRKIRRLLNEPVEAGSHQRFWDGHDDRGSPVPQGVYFARLSWNGRRQSERVTILR
jgi:hypothetical protein